MSELRLRDDLAAETVTDGAHTFVDVFDPMTGEGFRFFQQEFAVACGLDGTRDAAGIVRWCNDELGLVASTREVHAVIQTLDGLGYLTRAGTRPLEASEHSDALVLAGSASRAASAPSAPVIADVVPRPASGPHVAKPTQEANLPTPSRAASARVEADLPTPARSTPARVEADLPTPARSTPARVEADLPTPARSTPARVHTDLPAPARPSSARPLTPAPAPVATTPARTSTPAFGSPATDTTQVSAPAFRDSVPQLDPRASIPARETPARTPMESRPSSRPVAAPPPQETQVDANTYEDLARGVVAPKVSHAPAGPAEEFELGRPGSATPVAPEFGVAPANIQLGAPGAGDFGGYRATDEDLAARTRAEPSVLPTAKPAAPPTARPTPQAAPPPAVATPVPAQARMPDAMGQPGPRPSMQPRQSTLSKEPLTAPTTTPKRTSPLLWGALALVVAGAGAFAVKKFVLDKPVPAPPLPSPSVPAPPAPTPKRPVTQLSVVPVSDAEVRTPVGGNVLSVQAEGSVEKGTRILRFAGADTLDANVIALNQSIDVKLPAEIAKLTAERDASLAKTNGRPSQVSKARETSLAKVKSKLATETAKRDAVLTELAKLELFAPAAGVFHPKTQGGATVAANDVIGMLTPPPLLVGKLAIDKTAPIIGQSVNLVGGNQTLRCTVRAVEATGASVECPFTEGTNGVDFGWGPPVVDAPPAATMPPATGGAPAPGVAPAGDAPSGNSAQGTEPPTGAPTNVRAAPNVAPSVGASPLPPADPKSTVTDKPAAPTPPSDVVKPAPSAGTLAPSAAPSEAKPAPPADKPGAAKPAAESKPEAAKPAPKADEGFVPTGGTEVNSGSF